jgi:hypothetical protein
MNKGKRGGGAFRFERHGLRLSLPSLAPASAFGGQEFRDSALMPEHWHLNTLNMAFK